MGKVVDADSLLMKNEEIIAMGNMKVNARGDLLGPGGKIIKTKDQLMKEYYALNTPVAVDPMDSIADNKPAAAPVKAKAVPVAEPIVIDANSGIDDNDEGPAVAVVVDKPIEEILATPVPVVSAVSTSPQVAAMTVPVSPITPVEPVTATFVQKEILPGIPTAASVPLQADVLTDPVLVPLRPAVSNNKMPPAPPETIIRGNLASAIANTTTITQKELLPPKKADGIQRF